MSQELLPHLDIVDDAMALVFQQKTPAKRLAEKAGLT
jgi:hypothetical protein